MSERGELRLAAALYNGDHAYLADEVARLVEAGLDALHLDVFDGRLLPHLAFAPRTLGALRRLTRLAFEVHLVAERPERFAGELAEAGADLVLVQAEGAPMLHESLFAFREHGLRVGVALGLATPLAVAEAALPLVDAVLLLSRVTGEGTRGASFDARALPRIRALRAAIDASDATVELHVAGGVHRGNLGGVARSGADAVALGAGLFRVNDLGAEMTALRMAAGAGLPA